MAPEHATPAMLEAVIKLMRIQIGAMPQEAQEDIDTFCRSFRNQLAAGPVAKMALMLISAELALDTARKMQAARKGGV